MDFIKINKTGQRLLDIFSDIRLQDTDLDYAAQHYVMNAYPLIDMVERAITFSECVQFHFDRVKGETHGQQQLF